MSRLEGGVTGTISIFTICYSIAGSYLFAFFYERLTSTGITRCSILEVVIEQPH